MATNYPNSIDALITQTLSPDFAKLVYINSDNPSTATIFDLNIPATTNDDTLKQDSNNAYIGTDGKTWVWNGTSYIAYNPTDTTEWRLQGSLTDAKGDKINKIWRSAGIMVGDGTTAATNVPGYFVARGDFSANSQLFAFQNTNPLNTGMALSNGAGPGQFLPGLVLTPSGALRSIVAVNVLPGGDVGFQEPAFQIRSGVGLTSLVNRPSFEVLNGLRVDLRLTAAGNLLIGTTSNPGQERLVVNGAAKIGNPYGTITNGATTPVPNGGAGTMVFSGTNFFGWNGTSWKQLDN
jgi:hypothetical protein